MNAFDRIFAVTPRGPARDAFDRKRFLWQLSGNLGQPSPVRVFRYADGPDFARSIRPGIYRRVTRP